MKKIIIALMLVLSISTSSQAFLPVLAAWTAAQWSSLIATGTIATAGAYMAYKFSGSGPSSLSVNASGDIKRTAQLAWITMSEGVPSIATANIQAVIPYTSLKPAVDAAPTNYTGVNSAMHTQASSYPTVNANLSVGDRTTINGQHLTVVSATHYFSNAYPTGLVITGSNPITGYSSTTGPWPAVGQSTETFQYTFTPAPPPAALVAATPQQYVANINPNALPPDSTGFAPVDVTSTFSGDIDRFITSNPNVLRWEDNGSPLVLPTPVTPQEMGPFLSAADANQAAQASSTSAAAAQAASNAAQAASTSAQAAAVSAAYQATVAAQNLTSAQAAAANATTAMITAQAQAANSQDASDKAIAAQLAAEATAAQNRVDIAKGYADLTAVMSASANAQANQASAAAAQAAAIASLASALASAQAKEDALVAPEVVGNSAYDSTIEIPAKRSIPDLLTSFVAGSPIVSMVKSFKITTSATSCNFPIGTIYGKELSFDFCRWQPTLTALGGVLLIIMHGFAVLIVVRGW